MGAPETMTVAEVLTVLDALAGAGCRTWVGGGWGVDALVGRQTRDHRDLDLAIDALDEPAALEVLQRLDYTVETDWRPVRVELVGERGRVDVHPVVFEPGGRGVQAGLDGAEFVYPADCFVSGTIGGRPVGCLSVTQQIAFHTGYEPSPVDLTDLVLLRGVRI